MFNKKKSHDEHVDESWLIPYADMLTLLLALFIVMFASSQIDKDKFDKMKEQFGIIFSGGSGVFEGSQMKPGIPLDNQVKPNPPNTPIEPSKSVIEKETEIMDEIKQLLDKYAESSGYSEQIKTKNYRDGLEISIQDTVLFESGKSDVLSVAVPLLSVVGKMLNDIENDVKVIGHTDNLPISTVRFQSNWELSVSRAVNVMYQLTKNSSVSPERFIIQGHGEYKPKYDNTTEVGRSRNRRVEIFIIRKHPVSVSAN